jgi:mRNA interferase MazF
MIAGNVFDCDWREDVLPKEPNKAGRPAIIVEDTELFPPDFPNVVVVACTKYLDFAIPSLSVRIEPSAANGLAAVSYAVAHQVTVVSKRRLGTMRGTIEPDALSAIRAAIAESLGITLR